MLHPNAEIKKFEVLVLTKQGKLVEAKGKGKFLNDVKFFVWMNFDDAEIIDVKWL
ncbi:hypothetical protein [Enterococcus faecium]|uniref:hypothetical protein n=1 Tax=Enterococcus faecium TaxID=1352 RepID=UPI0015E3F6DB|nr:hypothetical protein [Enterococcus faecium]